MSTAIDHEKHEISTNCKVIEDKLRAFGVDGAIVAVMRGPVITTYEFAPAVGTRVNGIVGLQKDLSVALGGRLVRIIPCVKGKSVVGIEVPNEERKIVLLKDVIGSQEFNSAGCVLPLALGLKTDGTPFVEDLAKMPHLLIAGATGSGKSVAINSLIIGMMYKIAPSDLRFILIDPKRVELSSFNGCPHLFLPTVTEPQEAMRVLLWGIEEMERRYRLMADASVKNIADYNKKILTGKIAISPVEEIISAMQKNPKAIIHGMTFPHIVIVIDEIADLMMKMGTEMEDILVRLAQMARSAGIHLIIATQRPSADVVTGLIKANFPARIAFRVATKWDSRVVLDSSGAETLLGNGDMLFLNPFGGDLIRAHGAYVSEEEIEQITEDLKAAGGG